MYSIFCLYTIFYTVRSVLIKSGSDSSLSEACDSLKESTKRFESERDDCSDDDADTDTNAAAAVATKAMPLIKKNGVTNTSTKLDIPQQGLMIKRGSLTSAKSLHEFKHEHSATTTSTTNGAASTATVSAAVSKNYSEDEMTAKRGIRPSKSDTSLTESFVIVDGTDYGGRRKNVNSLREGQYSAPKLMLLDCARH